MRRSAAGGPDPWIGVPGHGLMPGEPGHERSAWQEDAGPSGYDEAGYSAYDDEAGYSGYDEAGYSAYGEAGYSAYDEGAAYHEAGFPADEEASSSAPQRGRRRRPRRRRRWVRIVLALLVVFLVPVAWSVGHALTVPGGGTVSDRLAEWARDHYLGPVVTFGEWLTYQPPKVGGKPSFSLAGPGAAAAVATGRGRSGRHLRAARRAEAARRHSRCPARATWRVLARVHGEPAIYGTYLRAEPRVHLVRGRYRLDEPEPAQVRAAARAPRTRGPANWKAAALDPAGHPARPAGHVQQRLQDRVRPAAASTSTAPPAGPLTNGTASVVYYRDGHIAIGVWGRDRADDPGRGRRPAEPAPDRRTTAGSRASVEPERRPRSWGATLGGGYYVWRSGIGITARRPGHLRLRARR